MAEEDDRPKQDRLSSDEAMAVKRFLEDKGVGDAKCELCGASTWGIEYHLVSPMALRDGGSPYFAGRAYPSVPLICSNCGNMKLINVLVTGVRRAPPRGEDGD